MAVVPSRGEGGGKRMLCSNRGVSLHRLDEIGAKKKKKEPPNSDANKVRLGEGVETRWCGGPSKLLNPDKKSR